MPTEHMETMDRTTEDVDANAAGSMQLAEIGVHQHLALASERPRIDPDDDSELVVEMVGDSVQISIGIAQHSETEDVELLVGPSRDTKPFPISIQLGWLDCKIVSGAGDPDADGFYKLLEVSMVSRLTRARRARLCFTMLAFGS